MTSAPLLLFSYGTLRQPEVQRALFGRLLHGTPDVMDGWRLDSVTIADADVVATSGAQTHPILLPDPDAAPIAGMALEILPHDLAPADAYETDAYRRITVTLRSGRAAFVYVAA